MNVNQRTLNIAGIAVAVVSPFPHVDGSIEAHSKRLPERWLL